jgi:hypothetical protein
MEATSGRCLGGRHNRQCDLRLRWRTVQSTGRADAGRRDVAASEREAAGRWPGQDRCYRRSLYHRRRGGLRRPAYPHRLQEMLRLWYPSIPITVVNKGVPRQTAQQMLERFPSDVIAEDPVLVIWETGTTDAVRGVEVEELAAALQSGIDELKTRSIDIMLVDMQFSRSTVTVIDFERYLNTLHRVGDVNDVYVFPRFEMMRYWSEQNVFNFDGVSKDERASLAASVYECIGKKLAETIRVAIQ